MKIGNNIYKLIFLDTNALREIVTDTNAAGKGFLQNFFIDTTGYAPCFSIYNVIELVPYGDIFDQFIEFFSVIPCILTFPVKSIFQKEYDCYITGSTFQIDNNIAYAFSPISSDQNHDCKKFFDNILNNKPLIQTIHSELDNFPSIATIWNKEKENAKKLLKTLQLPLNLIDEKFYKSQEKVTVLKDLQNFNIPVTSNTDIFNLPAARMMEYSHFSRIYFTQKKIIPNDVMDIQISCIAPYVDAVITENFQADVYKKAKRLIPQLKKLEIYTLKDIRTK